MAAAISGTFSEVIRGATTEKLLFSLFIEPPATTTLSAENDAFAECVVQVCWNPNYRAAQNPCHLRHKPIAK
jgi:hypothetical protein